MVRVVRVRYERGVLRPLEKLELREGEEFTVIIKGKSFYDVVREIEAEAREDVDEILREVRERGRSLYQHY